MSPLDDEQRKSIIAGAAARSGLTPPLGLPAQPAETTDALLAKTRMFDRGRRAGYQDARLEMDALRSEIDQVKRRLEAVEAALARDETRALERRDGHNSG